MKDLIKNLRQYAAKVLDNNDNNMAEDLKKAAILIECHPIELDALRCSRKHQLLDISKAMTSAIETFAKKLQERSVHYSETVNTFDFDGVTIEDIDEIVQKMKEDINQWWLTEVSKLEKDKETEHNIADDMSGC